MFNKIIIFILFLLTTSTTLANPYVDFNVEQIDDKIIVQYNVIDNFYLKNISLISEKGEKEIVQENNKIIFNLSEKENLFQISYTGCVSETICQEKENIVFQKNENSWSISNKEITGTNNQQTRKNAESSRKNDLKDYINDPNIIMEKLKENGFFINLFIFFLIGLLLSFTPCIFPMLPIVSSIVIKNDNKNPFILSSFYALGIAGSYALIGLIMGTLNLNLQIYFQNVYVILGMSILFFILGYLMISNYTFSFFNKSNNFLNTKAQSINSTGYFSTFTIGFISSLVISPCAAAPIIGILIYMQTEQHDLIQQMSILFSLGLGAGVPLILISSSFKKFLPKNGNWMNKVKDFFGAILFAVGVYTLQKTTHIDLSGLYIIIALVYLSDFIKKKQSLYLVFSLLILFSYNLFLNQEPQTNERSIEYIKVENINQMNEHLKNAKENKKPVFIDIYADWCTTCIKMEKETLNSKDIIDFIDKKFLAIKVDITEIDKNKQNILKHYKLQTAPAYIFYDSNGNLEKKYYIGFLSEKEFLNILKKQIQ